MSKKRTVNRENKDMDEEIRTGTTWTVMIMMMKMKSATWEMMMMMMRDKTVIKVLNQRKQGRSWMGFQMCLESASKIKDWETFYESSGLFIQYIKGNMSSNEYAE